MHITCPSCGFSANVDPNKLSPKAAVANCPQCKHRFRFRQFDQDEQTPEQPQNSGVSESQFGAPPSAPSGDSFDDNAGTGRNIPPSSYDRPPSEQDNTDFPQPSRTPGAPGDPPKDIWDELDSEHRPDRDDSTGTNNGWRDSGRQSGDRNANGRGFASPPSDARGGYDNRGQDPWGQRPGNAGRPGASSDSWRARLGLEGGSFREIPWEHPEKYGYANGFFETCKRILLAPMRFFGEMSPTSSVWPKLAFACFWKFFDLILTFIYRPDLLQKLLAQSEIPLQEGNSKVMVVIVALVIISLVMLGIFMLGAFICRLCAGIVLRRKVDFETCLAIVCYPNVLLIFSVLPFVFLTVPLALAMMVFNGLALYKGLKLNSVELIKMVLLLILSGVAFGAVLALLISSMVV